jgi:histidine triad (HIT) family protein
MTGMTIFDKILRKEIPADVVHEDEWVLAFRDVNPQAPVHVLVIPKRRVERFAHLGQHGAAEVGEFFQRVAAVATKLKLDEPGYRVVVNNGRDGNQTVEYLHAHIIGGRRLTWPPG